MLLENVILNGKYWLKKGNFVLIPVSVQHAGRHYTTTQILSLTALLVLQVDVIPVVGG